MSISTISADFGTDAVEEVTVVRHHQQAEVGAAQVFFEPFRHIEVEVVGRLVEYQQVGFGDEGIGKCHALQLPAGEVFYQLVEVADFELRKDLFRFLLILPGLLVIHADKDFIQSGMSFRLHAALVLLYQLDGAVAMMEAGFEHGQFFGVLRVLLQIAYAQIAPEGDGAGVIAFLAGKDIEQRSLAGAVLGYQADALPLGHAEREILE